MGKRPENDKQTCLLTYEQCDTALCVWEFMLELHRDPSVDPFAALWERYGTYTMRELAVLMATDCDAAWNSLTPEQQDATTFDWEFVPDWVMARAAEMEYQWH